MRDGGKGDARRPLGVPKEQFENNWDAIFKKAIKDYAEKEAFKGDTGGVPLIKENK